MHLLAFFHFGEVAETAAGNVTSDFYSTSLQQGRNARITKDGAAAKRGGTAFVDECYVDGTSNPMPFLFGYRSTDAAYMLEFSGHPSNRVHVRVFSEAGALVTSFNMPASIASTSYGQGDFVLSDPLSVLRCQAAGDEIYVFSGTHCMAVITYTVGGTFSVAYMTLNGNPYLRKDLDEENNNRLDSSGAYTTAGTSRLTFDAGGTFSTISSLSAREAKDVDSVCTIDFSGGYPAREAWIGKHVYLTDGSEVALIEITRIISGDKIMGVVKQSSNADNPWTNASAVFWSPVLGSRCTVSLSSDTVDPFNANDKNLSYMIDGGAGIVKSITDADTAVLEIVRQGLVSNAGAANNAGVENGSNISLPNVIRSWARPAWGNNTALTYTGAVVTGWPRLATLFQGRLFCGRSTAEPSTVWGSKSFALSSFAPGPDDNEGIQSEVFLAENDALTVLFGGPVLFAGSRSGLYRATVRDGVITSPMTFSNELGYGFESITPVQFGTRFALVKVGYSAIVSVRYNDSIGVIEDSDMTRFASHICEESVSQLASSMHGDETVYVLRGDGRVAAGVMATAPEQPSWTQFTFSQFSSAGVESDATVGSISVLRGLSGDQLWMSVTRTINGATRKYLERILPDRFLDCSLDIDGVTVTGTATGVTVSGLSHLNGSRISVLLGNGWTKDLTVSGGSVTVPVSYNQQTVSASATTGAVTLTFSSGATSDMVGHVIALDGGGAVELTSYSSSTSMGGTVLTTLAGTGAYKWTMVTPFLAGIPYKFKLKPHRLETQLRDGTAQMRMRKVARVGCRVVNTRHLTVSTVVNGEEINERPFQFARTNTPMDAMRPAFSGDIETALQSGYGTDADIVIATDGPWAATVTLIKQDVDFQDGTANGTR